MRFTFAVAPCLRKLSSMRLPPATVGPLPRVRLLPRILRDRVLLALALLLGVGLLLRVYFLFVWRPAITGFSDSGIFFEGARQGALDVTGAPVTLWSAPGRTVGYSMFLRVLHAITPHLILVTIVQHVLGLLAAVLFFLAVRRCGGPRWLGLAPAAVIALGGDELFVEHAALSEALFIFLLSAMLYCAVRASRGSARWAALAGLCAGLSVWDRVAGLALVAVIAIWLLFSTGRPTRRSIAVGALSLVVSLASLGVYVEWRHAASGLSGLTTNGSWSLYGRVAPWADCTKFTPPPGTRPLCQTMPPARRGYNSSAAYIFNSSPAEVLFGPSYRVSKYPHAMTLLREWSQAAILGQPLDYLHAVWLDTIRLVDPNHPSFGSYSADEMIAFMLYGPDMHSGANKFVTSWQHGLYPGDPAPHRGDIGPLKTWERITRVDGVWMVILLVLCLAGPLLVVGRARAGTTLFAVTALTLLFVPILTTGYDYRYTIPAFAPLFAAGALAAWGLTIRIRAKRRVAPT
jgi:hypothetical protein